METQLGDLQNGGGTVANSTRRSLHDGGDDDSLEDSDRSRKTMSNLGRFFIGAAVFHACAVVTFQSAILGLGDFSADCQGGLGFDRKIYAILFISAMAYVIVLVIWALYSENIVEIYAFCVVQLLSIAYSCTQVYQFYLSRSDFEKRQPNSVKTEDYEAPIILAVSNVILSVCMMVFYIYATYHLYIEFGWKIYTTVPFKAEAKLRGAFSTYQIFTCFLKVELFFTEMFLLSHVTLLLRDDTDDPEFIASVVAMVLAIAVVIIVYLAVRRESKVIMLCFLVILLAMCGYYSFKVFRFVTKSCRLCKRMTMEDCPLLIASSEPTTAAPNDNLTFEHLSLFAIIVDINTALLFLVSLNYMSKFGSGLEKFFKGLKGLKLLSVTYNRQSIMIDGQTVANIELAEAESRPRFHEGLDQRPRLQERSDQRPIFQERSDQRQRFQEPLDQRQRFQEPLDQRQRFQEPLDQRRFSSQPVPVIELQVIENRSTSLHEAAGELV